MNSEKCYKWLEEEMLSKLEFPSIIIMNKQSTIMWKSTRKQILIHHELVVTAWIEFQLILNTGINYFSLKNG